ncbi:ArnT family glycosyltransferase [Haloprofundus halobius]|uniref:ArnT family glycosyltransferase n=1 Tax=Haloprofundus halobius TaxID=2876194 RepID=UPI001CD02B44|nr:glycosyltransferase family 39 protein [Haloprofundus halobius]
MTQPVGDPDDSSVVSGLRELRPSAVAALFSRADARYVAPVLLAGVAVYFLYLAANAYPGYGAGLYNLMGEQIAANGYLPPESIPYYTVDGVPFAYPPLLFYVIAVIRDVTGVGPFALARFFPGLVTIAYLVPTYLLARDVLASRPAATAVGLLVALNPKVLQWHITAGGVVRAPAFLFAVCGIYAGYRLYAAVETTGYDRRWLAISSLCFGLTMLTHPTYTLFFVGSFVILWLSLDRSLAGFLRGGVVAAGGFALATPWLVWNVSTHGLDVFTAASGTHGGIGGGFAITAWHVIPLVLAAALFLARRPFLGVWTVAAALLFQQARFVAFVGTFGVVALALPRVRAAVAERVPRPKRRTVASVAIAATLVVGLGVVGYSMTVAEPSIAPQFVDDDDVAAMEWVGEETPEDATFVVVGDAAEWFPDVSKRTMTVGLWGVEWEGAETYAEQKDLYRSISECPDADCVSETLDDADVTPDYLYVPKGTYVLRGKRTDGGDDLVWSLMGADGYEEVYENDGVVIFRVESTES